MRSAFACLCSCVAFLDSKCPAAYLGRVAGVIAVGLAACFASAPSHALVELTGISKIAAGDQHTCALTTAGSVKCWGRNDFGQLGDDSTTGRMTPVDVVGLVSGVAAITAGGAHTCALTTAGGVKCWGRNVEGQLGDATTTQRLSPTDVSGLASGVAAIAAGGNHTCAITTSGGLKCWGHNSNGEVGDGSTSQRSTPVDVSGLASGVAAIATGGSLGNDHTCALTTAGGVKCWGYNGSGQQGDGTTSRNLTPINVVGLTSGVTAITAGGSHTCALTTAEGVKCWGSNFYGQVGDTTFTRRLTPVDVSGLTSGIAAIVAGGLHTCARTTASGVKCWGLNYLGQLGSDIPFDSPVPVDVSNLAGVAGITAGGSHSCALTTVGGVKCWGYNLYGQLGDNTPTHRLMPVDVPALTNGVTAIGAGVEHTCALTATNGIKCWGWNNNGQLGDATTSLRLTPVDVSGLTSGVAAVAVGGGNVFVSGYTCALTTGGGVKCWGQNLYGEIGDNTSGNHRLTPVDVSGLTSGMAAITAGENHTCALTSAGGVKCWGYNGSGRLGDNSTTSRLTSVDVSGLSGGVAAIAAGKSHTCALTTTGGVKCWGYNGYGQLGDNSTTQRLTPVDVSGLASGIAAIAAGGDHTCALTMAGGVKCWGRNDFGQLGDGSATGRMTPVDVVGLASGMAAITTGRNHTCVRTTAGGAKCWGYNGAGQLGDNSTTQRSTPVDASGLASGVAVMTAGGNYTCTLTTAGGVKCWGDNTWGQLGDGTTGIRPFPAPVLTAGPPGEASLDVDASITASKYDALTDGLLVIRYLLGVTGESLTNGTLGGTATRTDPGVIKAYLDGSRAALDIDGNGTADALTDGLLIIRYLFGLRGDALIGGAVDPEAARKTAPEIEASIQALMP